MTSVKEISAKLNELKKREENKKCFDCGEKGTTYVCINFGTFICSRCAGILRELNYKVKGTGVSMFNQTEIDLLDKMGNENAAKIWLAKYKEGKDKHPSLKDDDSLRKFIKDKYNEKKWYKKPKKEKEEKKSKKGGKKNKDKDESSDDEEDEESEEESESEDDKKDSKKNKDKNKNKDKDKDKEDSDDDSDEKKDRKKPGKKGP